MASRVAVAALAVALVVVHGADLASTARFEPCNEGNPLARAIWERVGFCGLVALKAGTVVFMLAWVVAALSLTPWLGKIWEACVWIGMGTHLGIVLVTALRNYVLV